MTDVNGGAQPIDANGFVYERGLDGLFRPRASFTIDGYGPQRELDILGQPAMEPDQYGNTIYKTDWGTQERSASGEPLYRTTRGTSGGSRPGSVPSGDIGGAIGEGIATALLLAGFYVVRAAAGVAIGAAGKAIRRQFPPPTPFEAPVPPTPEQLLAEAIRTGLATPPPLPANGSGPALTGEERLQLLASPPSIPPRFPYQLKWTRARDRLPDMPDVPRFAEDAYDLAKVIRTAMTQFTFYEIWATEFAPDICTFAVIAPTFTDLYVIPEVATYLRTRQVHLQRQGVRWAMNAYVYPSAVVPILHQRGAWWVPGAR
ncbi:MAG TPA: hypothetical protein VGW38_25015 [Chloroflexota bacterium]|nr:hypothetical protein [Chloroflexota bacterium]